MTILNELAERCEKATGPCRELDKDIAIALGAHTVQIDRGGRGMMLFADSGGPLPLWTASLDAAMTLYLRVPERVPSDPRLATAEALRQRAEAA